jgi:hypothetical protein
MYQFAFVAFHNKRFLFLLLYSFSVWPSLHAGIIALHAGRICMFNSGSHTFDED